MKIITDEIIYNFKTNLYNEEKSSATVAKYVRDVENFKKWLGGKTAQKSEVLKYKAHLIESYAVASVNAALSSLNSFFAFCEWYDLRVKTIKVQRRIFASEERQLNKDEYRCLLKAAKSKKNGRLFWIIQTICSTGIRVSELRYITVDAVNRERTEIRSKGKQRTVFLPGELCRMLKKYIKEKKIKSGAVFVTKNGNPLDRSNIWSDMKKLCESAGVSKDKVFPHNLRHLFARTYYSTRKDIVRLADILGHSSVNTTRLYTMETGEVHKRHIERLGLLKC